MDEIDCCTCISCGPDEHCRHRAYSEGLEGAQLSRDEVSCILIDEGVAVWIYFSSNLADHDLRLVEDVSVQEDENLTEMILRPCTAQDAGRAPLDHHRLTGERSVGKAGQPVDSVLQNTRHGIVILGGDNDDAVRRGDLMPKATTSAGKPSA